MAATSFTDYAPFDAGVGALRTEDWWRDYARNWHTDGVLKGEQNGLEVYADSSGLQVKVKTGRCMIRSHWGKMTTETTLAIDANSSGNPRIDRVVARVDASNNVVELDILKGTAGVSPSAPTLATGASDIWEISLAQIAVANSATTIASTDVTDERSYVMPGGTTKLSVKAYRANAIACSDGTLTDLDLGNESWNDIADGRFHSTSTNTNRLYAPWDGRYELNVAVEWDTNATGYRLITALKNGTDEICPPAISSGWTGRSATTHLNIPEIRLSKGDYVRLRVRQNSGGSLNVLGTSSSPTGTTHAIWRYLGA